MTDNTWSVEVDDEEEKTCREPAVRPYLRTYKMPESSSRSPDCFGLFHLLQQHVTLRNGRGESEQRNSNTMKMLDNTSDISALRRDHQQKVRVTV